MNVLQMLKRSFFVRELLHFGMEGFLRRKKEGKKIEGRERRSAGFTLCAFCGMGICMDGWNNRWKEGSAVVLFWALEIRWCCGGGEF